MDQRTIYKVYEGDFPDVPVAGLCVKNSDGDYVNVDSGTVFSGDTHNEVKVFIGQVFQIVAPELLGVNQNYQDAKIPFIGCALELEELELHDGTNRIYFCDSIDNNWHEDEFDKISEVFRNAVEI